MTLPALPDPPEACVLKVIIPLALPVVLPEITFTPPLPALPLELKDVEIPTLPEAFVFDFPDWSTMRPPVLEVDAPASIETWPPCSARTVPTLSAIEPALDSSPDASPVTIPTPPLF